MTIDIKDLRKKLGMSQSVFCKAYDIPLSSLQFWEQKIRKPRTAAQSYLMAISLLPKEIKQALEVAKKKTGVG